MVWIYSPTEPEPVEVKMHLGQKVRTVNFNIEETTPEVQEKTGFNFRYQSVTLEPGIWSYPAIVSAIIKERYPDDAMDAIVNNYLADPKSEEYKMEMQEMQDWRANAKELAQIFLRIDPAPESVQNLEEFD